jgi:DNA-binding phage protein
MKNKGCGKLMAKYLTVGLNSGKAELFQEAFGDMVENQGGLKAIAKKAKMPVRLLKKTLADRAAFQRWVDIAKIVKVLGGNRMEFHQKNNTIKRERA